MSTQTVSRLPQARYTLIVDDGAERWAMSKQVAYAWLRKRGISPGYDYSRNIPNTAKMDADTYQDLCDSTPHYAHLTHQQLAVLEDRGAEVLYIQ